MFDGRNFFDQPINSMTKTYENIRRIATVQGDDYTTGCLLDYTYFKNHYKLIQEQFDKLILQHIQIEKEIQQCYLLLKKQKKLVLNFYKNP